MTIEGHPSLPCPATTLTEVRVDPQRQEQARRYAAIRRRLFVAELALGAAFALSLLASGVSVQWKQSLLRLTENQFLLVGFSFLAFYVVYDLLTFPIGLYSFKLAHRFDLSTQTFPDWLLDWAKGLLLGLVLGGIIVQVVYYFLAAYPPWWWLLTAIALLFFTVVLTNLAPVVIVPLFFQMTPLADEELARRLMGLAARAGTRVRSVETINMSRKTKTANAALIGLGNTRRIVLGDTLLERYTADEVETVLAHELAHHVHADIPKGVAAQSALTLGGLYVASLALDWGVINLGFASAADIAAMPLLTLVMGAFASVTMPLVNAYSRHLERAADDYALHISRSPKSFATAMAKLADQNLSEVEPSRWAELLFYDHPPIGQRIRRAQQFLEQRGKGV